MSQTFDDDLGYAVDVPEHVGRIVSMVPSLTESVAVSATGVLVGATDWCTHPSDLDVTRVRGTKNPDIEAIVDLQPDVVLANEEENRAEDINALRAAGLAVWVTAPETLAAAVISLDRMLRLACRLERPTWLDEAERVWSTAYDGLRRRAVICIWRRPWMVIGRDTFAGDVLRVLGVDNVYAEASERYPKVPLDELHSSGADLVVLPDEPYVFSADDGPDAFPDQPVALVSGRHLTWYGPSLVEARDVLRQQLKTG